MYCRNCGEALSEKAAVCVKCGVKKGIGGNFCHNCGSQTAPNAAVCLKCGVSLTAASGDIKSKMVAGFLGIFLGGLGVHNFYLGFTKKAALQLMLSLVFGWFLFGLPALWGIAEGIMIFCGKITMDANGNPLE